MGVGGVGACWFLLAGLLGWFELWNWFVLGVVVTMEFTWRKGWE